MAPDDWHTVVAACRRVFPNRHDAEDAAAAAILDLHRTSKLDTATAAMLITVAKRKGIDDVRSAVARRVREQRVSVRETDGEDHADRIAEQEEAAWLVQEARRRLSPRAMELFELLDRGFTLHEAGALLGLTSTAAHSQLSRIRATLVQVRKRAHNGAFATVLAWSTGRRLLAGAAGLAVGCAGLGGVLLLDPLVPPASLTGEVAAARESELVADDVVHGASAGTAPTASGRENAAAAFASSINPAAPGSHSRKQLVAVAAPGQRPVVITKEETGGGETGPVEILQACLEDFTVTIDEIGCNGSSGTFHDELRRTGVDGSD